MITDDNLPTNPPLSLTRAYSSTLDHKQESLMSAQDMAARRPDNPNEYVRWFLCELDLTLMCPHGVAGHLLFAWDWSICHQFSAWIDFQSTET